MKFITVAPGNNMLAPSGDHLACAAILAGVPMTEEAMRVSADKAERLGVLSQIIRDVACTSCAAAGVMFLPETVQRP